MEQVLSTAAESVVTRRTALLSALGFSVLSGGFLQRAQAAESDGAVPGNIALVNAFCSAWASGELQKPFSYLAPDCMYRVTEKTAAVTGLDAIKAVYNRTLGANGHVEFGVLATRSIGPIVINHRIDHFTSIARPFQWEGVGVFFVKNDHIAEWQDFTIKTTR